MTQNKIQEIYVQLVPSEIGNMMRRFDTACDFEGSTRYVLGERLDKAEEEIKKLSDKLLQSQNEQQKSTSTDSQQQPVNAELLLVLKESHQHHLMYDDTGTYVGSHLWSMSENAIFRAEQCSLAQQQPVNAALLAEAVELIKFYADVEEARWGKPCKRLRDFLEKVGAKQAIARAEQKGGV